jgi:hypothetical protein
MMASMPDTLSHRLAGLSLPAEGPAWTLTEIATKLLAQVKACEEQFAANLDRSPEVERSLELSVPPLRLCYFLLPRFAAATDR